MATITTNQGDTWDTLARRAYGNELRAQLLMEARENLPLLDIEIFPAGLTVTAPEPPEEETLTADLPAWRR